MVCMYKCVSITYLHACIYISLMNTVPLVDVCSFDVDLSGELKFKNISDIAESESDSEVKDQEQLEETSINSYQEPHTCVKNLKR